MKAYQAVLKSGLLVVAFLTTSAAGAQSLELISHTMDARDQGNNSSFSPSVSAEGHSVAFDSWSTNLIPGGRPDFNAGSSDIFVFDRQANRLDLVSRPGGSVGSAQANSDCSMPSISDDGRFVAFVSVAGNLVPGVSGMQVYVFDRLLSEIELVSRQNDADGGAQGNGASAAPSIDANGRFVAFHSRATNLIPGGVADANGTQNDIFVFDRKTGTLELISRQDSTDGGAQANSSSAAPSISADGRFVAFESRATNLNPRGLDDANDDRADIYVLDRQTGKLELVSRQDAAAGGAQGNGASGAPSINADGRFVTFDSRATNLVPGGLVDVNDELPDVFVFDRQTEQLELVSRQTAADGGVQGNGASTAPSISADGRFVAFQSSATNLIPGGVADANGAQPDVFLFDRQTAVLKLVSRQDAADGAGQGDGASTAPSISADGRLVAFQSSATNLVPGTGRDLNGPRWDIFLYRATD